MKREVGGKRGRPQETTAITAHIIIGEGGVKMTGKQDKEND